MKRVIIADRIKQLLDFELFPEEGEVELVTAYSNEQILTMHRGNRADLIITELYGSGMNAALFCSQIRDTPDLCRVSIILYCRSNDIEISESVRCRANLVLTLPLERTPLRLAVHRLLEIPLTDPFQVRYYSPVHRQAV